MKKIIEKKNIEISQLKKDLDKHQVDSIKMTNNYEKALKELEVNKLLVESIKHNSTLGKAPEILKPSNNDILNVTKYSIESYRSEHI